MEYVTLTSGNEPGGVHCARFLYLFVGSILEVLKDPVFEHSQPSWMRTSLRRSQSQRLAYSTGMLGVTTAAGSATPITTTGLSPLGRDEVDQPSDGWIGMEEEVITEFQDDDRGEKKQVYIHYYVPFMCDDPLPNIVCDLDYVNRTR